MQRIFKNFYSFHTYDRKSLINPSLGFTCNETVLLIITLDHFIPIVCNTTCILSKEQGEGGFKIYCLHTIHKSVDFLIVLQPDN
jgi:hypothetical protein